MAIALSGCNTISSFACLYFRTYRMNTIYDFETMSQDPHTGAVLSFAMLNWDPKKLSTYSELVDSAAYIKFDVKEQVEKYNRVITKETVEEKILALQQRKLDLANELVTSDESILRALSEDEVLDLLS